MLFPVNGGRHLAGMNVQTRSHIKREPAVHVKSRFLFFIISDISSAISVSCETAEWPSGVPGGYPFTIAIILDI